MVPKAKGDVNHATFVTPKAYGMLLEYGRLRERK